MSQISWLTPQAAQETRDELLQALGTENNPTQWMDFMEAVTRLLPGVLSVGAPSSDTIQKSAIGQLGFKSWREMLEAPTSEGGLGWNYSAWKAWRRAWKRVQEWPYLRNLPLTAAQVNRIHQATKDRPEGFPENAAALEAWEVEQKEQRQESRNVSMETLKNQVADLEAQLKETTRALDLTTTKASNLEDHLRATEQVMKEVNQEHGKLQAHYDQLKLDNIALEHDLKEVEKKAKRDAESLEKARKHLKRYQGMSRWDHFKSALGLD